MTAPQDPGRRRVTGGPFPHASGQDVIGAGRCHPQPRRNQHTALQDAFTVQPNKQWGGGTGRGREEMGEGARFLLPRRSMPYSSAWQRDGCTGCSSIRDPQSDYKDTKDLSALKKDKRDAERFTLHASFPH